MLFNGPSVRAILAGIKTETRRVMKQQPRLYSDVALSQSHPLRRVVLGQDIGWLVTPEPGIWYADYGNVVDCLGRCPHGRVGDFLWGKEAACYKFDSDGDMRKVCAYRADLPEEQWLEHKYLFSAFEAEYHPAGHSGWRSPRYMPRWASRIVRQIIGIEAQRLGDMTEEQAIAEGMTLRGYWWDYGPGWQGDGLAMTALKAYEHTWNRLNAKRGYPWRPDLWVWRIQFERVAA